MGILSMVRQDECAENVFIGWQGFWYYIRWEWSKEFLLSIEYYVFLYFVLSSWVYAIVRYFCKYTEEIIIDIDRSENIFMVSVISTDVLCEYSRYGWHWRHNWLEFKSTCIFFSTIFINIPKSFHYFIRLQKYSQIDFHLYPYSWTERMIKNRESTIVIFMNLWNHLDHKLSIMQCMFCKRIHCFQFDFLYLYFCT